MKPITYEDFEEAKKKEPSYYVEERWPIYEKAIELCRDLSTVLEIGPYRLPLFRDSHLMDREGFVDSFCTIQDAGEVPWKFKSKSFDAVVMLQVFEHLGRVRECDTPVGLFGQIQPLVFREIERVSSRAVISVPWDWRSGTLRHRMINDGVFAEWTCHVPPADSWMFGRRKMFYFEF